MDVTVAKITIILGLLAVWGLFRLDRFLTTRRNLKRKTLFYKLEKNAQRVSKAWNYFLFHAKSGIMLYDLKKGILVKFVKAYPNPLKYKGYVVKVKTYDTKKEYITDILNVKVASILDYMRIKRTKKGIK